MRAGDVDFRKKNWANTPALGQTKLVCGHGGDKRRAPASPFPGDCGGGARAWARGDMLRPPNHRTTSRPTPHILERSKTTVRCPQCCANCLLTFAPQKSALRRLLNTRAAMRTDPTQAFAHFGADLRLIVPAISRLGRRCHVGPRRRTGRSVCRAAPPPTKEKIRKKAPGANGAAHGRVDWPKPSVAEAPRSTHGCGDGSARCRAGKVGETPGKKQIHFGKRLAREISASRSFFGLEFLRCGQFGV